MGLGDSRPPPPRVQNQNLNNNYRYRPVPTQPSPFDYNQKQPNGPFQSTPKFQNNPFGNLPGNNYDASYQYNNNNPYNNNNRFDYPGYQFPPPQNNNFMNYSQQPQNPFSQTPGNAMVPYQSNPNPFNSFGQQNNFGNGNYGYQNQMAPIERQLLEQYFDSISGIDEKLDRSEFAALFQQLYPQLGPNSRFYAESAFMQFDTNRDGYINFDEFVQAYQYLKNIQAIPN